MNDCSRCRFALWDYNEFYDPHCIEWFVDDCKKELEPDDCGEEYEEVDEVEEET